MSSECLLQAGFWLFVDQFQSLQGTAVNLNIALVR